MAPWRRSGWRPDLGVFGIWPPRWRRWALQRGLLRRRSGTTNSHSMASQRGHVLRIVFASIAECHKRIAAGLALTLLNTPSSRSGRRKFSDPVILLAGALVLSVASGSFCHSAWTSKVDPTTACAAVIKPVEHRHNRLGAINRWLPGQLRDFFPIDAGDIRRDRPSLWGVSGENLAGPAMSASYRRQHAAMATMPSRGGCSGRRTSAPYGKAVCVPNTSRIDQ